MQQTGEVEESVGSDSADSVQRANERFGQRLRLARKAADLTQRELAQIVTEQGVMLDPSAITRIERGERSAKVAEIIALAKALDTRASYLMGEEPGFNIEDLRRRADSVMHQSRSYLGEWVSLLGTLQHLVRQRPDFLEEFVDREDGSRPNGADDYLPWVRERVRAIVEDQGPVPVPTEADAREMRKILEVFFDGLVAVDPLPYPAYSHEVYFGPEAEWAN